MQHCWPSTQIELSSSDKMNNQNSTTLCELCLEPITPAITSDSFFATRERQSSEPVRVPIHLNESQPQSHSLGYESGFGNELSPSMTYWTLGKYFSFVFFLSIHIDLLRVY